MKDLYETLNVKKDATPEEIKRAYKSLAQKLHPDKRTEEEHFEKVANDLWFNDVREAYEILKDKDKRACYDETGRTNFSPLERESESIIVRMFSEIIEKGDDSGNIIEKSRANFESALNELESQIKRAEISISQLDKKKGRISCTDSNNIYENIIDEKIDSVCAERKNNEHIREVVRTAIKILEQYNDNDPKPVQVNMNRRTGQIGGSMFTVHAHTS